MPPVTVLAVRGVSKAFTAQDVFRDLSVIVHHGERVGLIGANGCGKSTLLRIMAGVLDPDEGERVVSRDHTLVYVAQSEQFQSQTVAEEVALHLPNHGDERTQAITLQRLLNDHQMDADAMVERLSGGWRKRLAIVCALAQQPDVLLLDEPSNHLDLDGLLWLEQLIATWRGTLVLVTHDRELLARSVNRVVEIGRQFPQGYISVSGDYAAFLEHRAGILAAQERQQSAMENIMRREAEWLRRRPKARTTKSVARIQRAADLQADLHQLNERRQADRGFSSKAAIRFEGGQRRTNDLVVMQDVSIERGGRRLIDGLTLTLQPGMRLVSWVTMAAGNLL